jgi:hypothetical protein
MGTERRRNGRRLSPPGITGFVRRCLLGPQTLVLVAMAVVMPIWLVGCGTGASPSAGKAPSSLNPPGARCSTSSGVSATPTSVPLRVERTGASVRVIVSMCVDGSGPFPFVLDTGAPSTVFDTHFLDHVPFGVDAPATILHQPGCTTEVMHVSVIRWSIGPVALATQSVSVVRMPGFGLSGQPMGLLGSDVLSRFGAVRIDYRAQLLTVAGPEDGSSSLGADPSPSLSPPVRLHPRSPGRWLPSRVC